MSTTLSVGTVFQTAAYFMFVIPRLRPGLLSLRSVLSSRQTLTGKKTCLATQTIRSVLLSRYECTEMQDRFSVFIQV